MTNLTFLGTGTALPDANRENSCAVLEVPAGLLLLDCGGSPFRLMLAAGLNPLDLRAIFISHNHPDHLMGLPTLLLHLWLVRYPHELLVFGNSSAIDTAEAVCAAAALGEHAITPRWHRLPTEGGPVELPIELGVTLQAAPTYHSRPTLALRIEDPRYGGLVYGADSGPCAALVELARGVETLIHECTVSTPYDSHATPEEAAATAEAAGVKRLILTHYSPVYTAPEEEVLARAGNVFRGTIAIAHDGEQFDLSTAVA